MSNRIRVSSVFVSKFDQAMYWMDRAKRAGVPRKMQIEGLLEELKLDLMDILVPPAIEEIRNAIICDQTTGAGDYDEAVEYANRIIRKKVGNSS